MNSTSTERVPIRFSKKKKLLFAFILLILSVVFIETGFHVVYFALHRELFPIGVYDDNIQELASDPVSEEPGDELEGGEFKWDGTTTTEVLHPYLGYVLDPQRNENTSYLGFPQKDDDPFAEDDGTSITVAIFGGSFAEGASAFGEAVMRSTLLEKGIRARILTVAMGGYKQPQQLIALAYLLSHGARIDVVVNIDGFNEVALPQSENIPKGVNPFYPRAWYWRTIRVNDQVTLRRMGRVAALQDDRRRWATLFRDLPKYSVIRNIVWEAYDSVLEKRIAEVSERIRSSEPLADGRFLTTGPKLTGAEQTPLYQRIADHWEACSVMMKAICDANGITYIHMLQPNQYFESERTLTDEERRIAFGEDHVYRPGVVQGYPILRARIDDLKDRGVDFHDLTSIYDDIPESIYIDECCHPNQLGYDIVAEYVARAISDALIARPAH